MGNLLIGQPLSVHNNAVLFLLRFGSADDIFQIVEFRSIDIVQLQQLVIIERFVLKAAVNGSFGIDLLDLLHHGIDAVFGHARACNGNNGTIVQKFGHHLTALFLILAGLTGKMHGFGQHLQCSVRSKVKHIAVGFLLSVNASGRLHAEDRLHILRCGGRIRS